MTEKRMRSIDAVLFSWAGSLGREGVERKGRERRGRGGRGEEVFVGDQD